jgi:hypothetical protein
MSIGQRVLTSKKPFIFLHTWTVSEDLLRRAIREEKSMDLDVCIDDEGNPYLGHSREYHEKGGEPYFDSLPLWNVVDRISRSNIVALVDCKHHGAWPVIEEPDFRTEWVPIEKLRDLKNKFPLVTTTACAKWPPKDLLTSAKYQKLIEYMRDMMKENRIDAVCLSVPDETVTDVWLRYFLAETIIPRIGIDRTDATKLTQVYIGETDDLGRASKSMFASATRAAGAV